MLHGQMRGVGLVFSKSLEVDINTGVIIGMIIVLLCDPRWNERDNIQVAQYCVLILLYGSCDLFSIQMTGNPIPQLEWVVP
jgi:cation/acetate symporter